MTKNQVFLVNYLNYQTADYCVYQVSPEQAFDESYFHRENKERNKLYSALYYHVGDTMLSRAQCLYSAWQYAKQYVEAIDAVNLNIPTELAQIPVFQLDYPEVIGDYKGIQTTLWTVGSVGIEDPFTVSSNPVLLYFNEQTGVVFETVVFGENELFRIIPHGSHYNVMDFSSEEEYRERLLQLLQESDTSTFHSLEAKETSFVEEMFAKQIRLTEQFDFLLIDKQFTSLKGTNGSVTLEVFVSLEEDYLFTTIEDYKKHLYYGVIKEVSGRTYDYSFEFSERGFIDAFYKFQELSENFTFKI